MSGGEFIVNTPTPTGANTNRQRPTIASSGSGPIVAWIENAVNPPGPLPHVKLQRFNREGQPSGSEIQVSTTDVDPAHRPAITGMIDGGFLVSWMDARSNQRIRAQRFSFDGSKKGPEFRVNTTDGFHQAPIATRLVNGNYVIAWRSDPSPPGGGALIFRIFDLAGSPIVGETRPNLSGFTGQKAMTFLDDNDRFVIAHVRGLGNSDIGVAKSAVEANVFEPNGASANIPIFATSGQEINSSSPTLAPLPGGQFLLAWVHKRADTFATIPSVKARFFPVAKVNLSARKSRSIPRRLAIDSVRVPRRSWSPERASRPLSPGPTTAGPAATHRILRYADGCFQSSLQGDWDD
jgi:hypothetical protein